MPIHMRMRKLRGPHMKKSMPFEPFRTHTQAVNLHDLERRFDAGAEVTLEALQGARAWRTRKGVPVKVLAKGELTKKLTVHAHKLQRRRPRGASRPRAAPWSGRRALASAGQRCCRRSSAPSRSRRSARSSPSRRRCSRCTASAPTCPVPGVNPSAVEQIQEQFGGGDVLSFLNVFSGGGLSRIALFALGIMPYITASIILQLLTVVVPVAGEAPEGGRGRPAAHHAVHALPHRRPGLRPVDRLRLPLPLVRLAAASRSSRTSTPARVFLIVISLTAGTILVMWMGELITQRGIGNGISLMIFASIVAGLPNGMQAWWTNPDQVFKRDDALRRAGGDRGGRLHPGGPAADPDPVRQARHRPPHDAAAGRPTCRCA